MSWEWSGFEIVVIAGRLGMFGRTDSFNFGEHFKMRWVSYSSNGPFALNLLSFEPLIQKSNLSVLSFPPKPSLGGLSLQNVANSPETKTSQIPKKSLKICLNNKLKKYQKISFLLI